MSVSRPLSFPRRDEDDAEAIEALGAAAAAMNVKEIPENFMFHFHCGRGVELQKGEKMLVLVLFAANMLHC